MFMNLHTLPAGKSMYTLYLTWDEDGTPRDEVCTEEVDYVYDSRCETFAIPNDPAFQALLQETYGDEWNEASIVGIVNQSDGFVVFDAFTTSDPTMRWGGDAV